MRAVLLLVLCLLGQALCGATAAHAQEGGFGSFLQRLFGGEPEQPRFEPVRPRMVPVKPRRVKPRASPFETPAPAKAQPEAKEPETPPSVFVNVIGDSLADLLA